MKFSILMIIAALVVSCQKPPNKAPAFKPQAKPQVAMPKPGEMSQGGQDGTDDGRDDGAATEVTVSVMSYNVENLFDDVKDTAPENTKETVIESAVLTKKLQQIAKGILQVNEGRGPDVLMVQEVENLNVLLMLNEHLEAAGYQTVELIDSNDERGIDVGIFSRFAKAGETKLHKMPFSDANPTRGILEVALTLPNGRKLHAFSFHFPSQANPTEQRGEAAALLRDLMLRAPASDVVVAAGDSNITTDEEAQNKYFHDTLKDLQVSHLLGLQGCDSCEGTYNYKGRWDFLDAVIVRAGATLKADSVRLPRAVPTQLRDDGTPRRFDKVKNEGISDHFPIYAEVVVPQ